MIIYMSEQIKSPPANPPEASEEGTAAVESTAPSENEAKSRILETATRLFASRGLEGVSTRDIAKESGLNISLISYYFGGKEGLYKEVLYRHAREAQARMHEIMQQHERESMTRESFSRDMKRICHSMAEMQAKSSDRRELFMREMSAGLPHARELYKDIFRPIAESVVGIIKNAQKKKILNPELNPQILFLAMVHACEMYMMVNSCGLDLMVNCPRIPEETDRYADELYKIFIEGHLL